MKRTALRVFLLVVLGGSAFAQEPDAAPGSQRRSWLNRMLHPFRPQPIPEYGDLKLRGLALSLELSPQPVKLSEVRQMEVKLTLTNKSRRPITLEFPSAQ